MKKQGVSGELGDIRWPQQKIKPLKFNELIALHLQRALRKKGGPKMKIYPYGLLKIKEL
jgi:hypothetical protein